MKGYRILLVFVALCLLFPAAAFAHDEECHVSYLFNAWVRPAEAAMPNSAVYGQLVHIGDMPDTLVSASSDAAEVVELHEMIMGEGDVMQMRPVEGGFVVPANGFLLLEPGGLHIMLIGLKQPLVPGDEITVTLNFEHAGAVELVAPVRDMDAEMAMGAMGEGGMAMDSSAMSMGMDWGNACAHVYFLDPWVRPSVPGAPNSAAFGMLVNLTGEDVTLVAANAEVAEVVELHEMVMGAGDVMQMRPIEGGIAVPADGTALLKRGGLHVMLINLTAELTAGESLDLTLTFDSGDDMVVTAPIREAEEVGGMHMGGMGHG
ncbi:MAG: copper chaperone PCu(A)C [Anaerolineae bacterium]|nr:copper chaperone PCu(A)C [Anaerolineae bacterium]NUQ05676.1 copper chaperone PCu(A)C [Anaerolineae bacterium]